MPTFVDFAGMNTLILSTGSFDENNIIESQVNPEFSLTNSEDELVGINLHRNGPYGYSSWKQIRASENPISRYFYRNNMLSLVSNGSIIDLPGEGGNNYRERYSNIEKYKEPVVTQKHYPIVWSVGSHFKEEETGETMLQKFSIVSSYGNQLIDFTNKEVSEKLGYTRTDEHTEYPEVLSLYTNGGLSNHESPITYWEFLQYQETVFPQQKYGYVDDVRNRPQFVFPYNQSRENRTKIISQTDFGFSSSFGNLSQSQWPLDASENVLTRTEIEIDYSGSSSNFARNGEGVLQNAFINFVSGADAYSDITSSVEEDVIAVLDDLKNQIGAGPIYSRKHTTRYSYSANTSAGMYISEQTSSANIPDLSGDALWETAQQREIKNSDGQYVKDPRHPFKDSYGEYADSVRRYGKNFSVIPEFRISEQLNDYIRSGTRIESDTFELTGAILGLENSSKENFFETYSNSEFMKYFEVVRKDHENFTTGEILNLKCKALKKFLPYDGFYPAQRTVQLAKSFYDSTKKHIYFKNENNVTIASEEYPFVSQNIINPLFAPGILFNSIKSGIAVDYPIFTGSITTTEYPAGVRSLYMNNFDDRIPFEALVNPQNYLAGIDATNNEPHLSSSNLNFSSFWDGTIATDYPLFVNNFLASCIDFFLPNGNLTSIISKPQGDGIYLKDGETYGMRIKMFRSMDKAKNPVFISGSSISYNVPQDIYVTESAPRETFTMYSRASSFGPDTIGFNFYPSGLFFNPLVQENDDFLLANQQTIYNGSILGQNFPFTPPYYHGDAWCTVTITGEGRTMTIEELQASASYEYSRYDSQHYLTGSSTIDDLNCFGPQSFKFINDNTVQLSSSLNIDGLGSVLKEGGNDSNFVIDTALDQNARWIIQTKFETPMLNFQHVTSENDNVSIPSIGSTVAPRGLWHQYGRIPEEQDGVFLSVGEIPKNYQYARMGRDVRDPMNDLSKLLGFSNEPVKLGRISQGKRISEAVVAVPYLETQGSKKFFRLDKNKVDKYKNNDQQSITTGNPNTRIGKSVLDQLDKMKKFILPPSFDFLNYDNVEPIAMYIFEFSHTFSQQDLSDIWQNVAPKISEDMEVSEVSISHPLLQKELLGPGGDSGNNTIKTPSNLKWMVFKAKQRAPNNYFKKVVSRSSLLNQEEGATKSTLDEFGLNSPLQYNWPYDYFSLVEMVRIDAEVELGTADFSNYSDVLPRWQSQEPPPSEIQAIVATLENDIMPELPAADENQRLETNLDDLPPQSGQGNALNRKIREQLDNTIEDIESRVAGKMGQSSSPENMQPGGFGAMVGEVDEARAGAGGITGALGGPSEEIGEGDGNDSAQGNNGSNPSGLGGGNSPGGIV